jgi:hypothetical protein
MSKQFYGIIGLCMLVASILVGLYGISASSVTAACCYLAGIIVLFIVFIAAFCAKCPVRDRCVHVVIGMLTRLVPPRPAGPYRRLELLAVCLFFGFVAIFPQYWLIGDPFLLVAFWILFAGEWVLTRSTCCAGCGNRFCMLRYER